MAMSDAEFAIWLQGMSEPEPPNDPSPIAAHTAEPPEREDSPLMQIDGETSTTTDFNNTSIPESSPPKVEFLKQPTHERSEVSLLPSQTDHVKRIHKIFDSFPFALDLSMLGAGKTYTSTRIAMERSYKHVIVICPVSVMPKWKHMFQTYNVPIKLILGYQSLRSVKYKQPKHGLLYRRDTTQHVNRAHAWQANTWVQDTIDHVTFETTAAYKEMVKEGLLLILDEVQNIKNVSSQFLAAKALIREITLQNGSLLTSCFPTASLLGMIGRTREPFKSHVLLVSGSPIDKQEQVITLFKGLGVMESNRIAQQNISTGVVDWDGMQEIETFCKRLRATSPHYYNAASRWFSWDYYAYTLFQHIFKPAVSSVMSPPPSGTRLVKRNAFYTVDSEGAEILRRGLVRLVADSNFNAATGTVAFQGGAAAAGMASISRSLQIIETGKIQLFARVAREELSLNSNLKVVLALNYTESIKDLTALLAEYSPLVMTGSTSEVKRGEILKEFQAPTLEKRLLICNQSVASTGIDLDDKHGCFPRLALVSPNYSTITSYQLGHRFQRSDTKSDARVHFVFAKAKGKSKAESKDTIELNVLDALSRKSSVMKETTSQQVGRVVFPGDHEEWIEEQ